jgi:hypothetical protein
LEADQSKGVVRYQRGGEATTGCRFGKRKWHRSNLASQHGSGWLARSGRRGRYTRIKNKEDEYNTNAYVDNLIPSKSSLYKYRRLVDSIVSE